MNNWELYLIGGGLLIEIVGAVVILYGIRTLWRVIAEEDETFPRFLLNQVRATYRGIIDAMSRLVGRPRGRNVPVPLTEHASITDALRVEKFFGRLDPDISTPEAISELENRINRMQEVLSDTANNLRAEREERRRSLETLRSDMTGQLTSRAEDERQRSVRALRAEIAGFWFITFGFILQGVGSLIGAWP